MSTCYDGHMVNNNNNTMKLRGGILGTEDERILPEVTDLVAVREEVAREPVERMVRYLVEKGFSLTQEYWSGKTKHHFACPYGVAGI